MAFDLSALITPDADRSDLILPFQHEEIDKVISQLPSDKAPGPDGFNGLFMKKCWHLIKDFYRLCEEFHNGMANLESINDSFITLVPKVPNPECE